MIVAIADTHAVIWCLNNDTRLSATAKSAFENAAQQGNQIGLQRSP